MWDWVCYHKNFTRVIFSWWNITLNEDKRKKIWNKVQLIGDEIQSLLKPSPFHPGGRNAYAHIALSIKEKYGCSYKDIPDDQYEEVIMFLENLRKNPN